MSPGRRFRRLHLSRWLTLGTVWRVLVPAGLLIVLNGMVVYPNDFWWHVRTGQIILSEGHIPTTDRFSFTRFGEPWINQAWLMQVVLYLLYRSGGLPLTLLVHAVTVTAGYTLLLAAVTRAYGLRAGVLATFLGAALGANNWALRPQTFSFLAFGALMYLVESHRRGHKGRLWGAIPLFAVWANSHGGFIFGIAALGSYVLGRLWEFWRGGMPAGERRDAGTLVAIGLLSLAALSLNPQGPVGLAHYVLGFVKSDVTVKYNLEFQPLVIRRWDGALFFASLFLLVAVMAVAGFRPRADQVLSVTGFAALSLWAQRNLAWYGFVLVPTLAAGLHAWRPAARPPARGKPWLNGLVLGLLGVGLVASLPWWRHALPLPRQRRELVTRTTPVAAMDFLCARAPDNARVYQYQPFSSYQIWACPRLKVFLDTRLELYPFEQWMAYFAIEQGRFDWEEVADRYGITHLFLSAEFQEQAVRAATASDCWQEIYRDERAVIFEKICPE